MPHAGGPARAPRYINAPRYIRILNPHLMQARVSSSDKALRSKHFLTWVRMRFHFSAEFAVLGRPVLATCAFALSRVEWRLAPLHSRGRKRGSVADVVADVVAVRLLDPRVHVVGVSQPTLLQVTACVEGCALKRTHCWLLPGLACMRHAPLYRFVVYTVIYQGIGRRM